MEEKQTSQAQANIFEQIVKLSGLDKKVLTQELRDYLAISGKSIEDLTLNEMRSIVSQYARRTILELLHSEK